MQKTEVRVTYSRSRFVLLCSKQAETEQCVEYFAEIIWVPPCVTRLNILFYDLFIIFELLNSFLNHLMLVISFECYTISLNTICIKVVFKLFFRLVCSNIKFMNGWSSPDWAFGCFIFASALVDRASCICDSRTCFFVWTTWEPLQLQTIHLLSFLAFLFMSIQYLSLG